MYNHMSMNGTALVIWLCACVKYWPYREVGSVCFSPEIGQPHSAAGRRINSNVHHPNIIEARQGPYPEWGTSVVFNAITLIQWGANNRTVTMLHARTQIELELPGITINSPFVVISNMHRLFLIFMHSPSDLVLKNFCLFGQPHRVRFTFAQQLTKRKRKQISHSYRLLGQKGIL